MKHSDGGKGSAPRKNRDNDAFDEGYERIFGKKKRRVYEIDEELDELEKKADEDEIE